MFGRSVRPEQLCMLSPDSLCLLFRDMIIFAAASILLLLVLDSRLLQVSHSTAVSGLSVQLEEARSWSAAAGVSDCSGV